MTSRKTTSKPPKTPRSTPSPIAPGLEPLAVPVENIENLEGNPRKGDVDAVAKSYETFGQRKPIVVRKTGEGPNGPTGVVIAGNHQLAAARKLGWEKIAAVFVEDDEITAKAYALADNRTAERGTYDREALAAMIADVQAEPELLAATAWTEEEIALLVVTESPSLNDPDTTPPLTVENPITKLGDVWTLGRHRLVCGDSTNPKTISKALEGHRARLLFTSPPYGLAREYKGGNLDPKNLSKFLTAAGPHSDIIAVNLGILREGGSVVRYWDDYIETAEKAGLRLVSWNVWDRGQPLSVAQQTAMFPIEHEFVFVFGSDPETPTRVDRDDHGFVFVFSDKPRALNETIPNKTAGKGFRAGVRNEDGSRTTHSEEKTIREFRELGTVVRSGAAQADTAKFGHPAMFPVELPRQYILAATNEHDLVLDTFGGAGTTLIAAHVTNRVGVAIELSPEYCDVICRRFEEHTGITPKRGNTEVSFLPEDGE